MLIIEKSKNIVYNNIVVDRTDHLRVERLTDKIFWKAIMRITLRGL